MIATDEETVASSSETHSKVFFTFAPFSGGDRVLHPSAGYKPASIHPSAWKGNSKKFGCKMLDDTLLGVRADRGSSGIDDRLPTIYGTAE
jgi:hypothetical protein